MSDKKTKTTLAERMKARQGLGRDSSLPKIFHAHLERLKPNPYQPRQVFDESAINELADSIAKHGLLSPITVMEDESNVGGYIIVTGERRFRAFEKLGHEKIPAILKTEGNKAVLGLIENLQRENLEPFEEADALQELLEIEGYTQDQLAEAIGRNKVSISESLSIKNLPEGIREEAQGDPRVTRSFLVELARVDDQADVWQTYKQHGLTIKDIRAIKKAQKEAKNSDVRIKKAKPKKNSTLNNLISSHAKSLSVRLTQAQKEKLEFSQQDIDLLKETHQQLTSILEQVQKAN